MLASISIEERSTQAGPLMVAGQAGLVCVSESVAVVGARAASRPAGERAYALAGELGRAGWVVLSGGAVGIDACAHSGALDAGAATVAVVAGGVRTPYPRGNLPLFEEILRAGGALASPFGESTPIQRWHFVRRNQVLARLARAVVVVEARSRSGSLHTAAAARAAGRLVAAVPGSPGTDALLAEGAAPVENAADLLEALAGRPRRRAIALPDPGTDAARALAALDAVEHRIEDICARSGLTIRQATRGLVELELAGLARPGAAGGYRRAPASAMPISPVSTIEEGGS